MLGRVPQLDRRLKRDPNQTLTTNCEVITKWHDVFLMWNPDDYDNIRDTR